MTRQVRKSLLILLVLAFFFTLIPARAQALDTLTLNKLVYQMGEDVVVSYTGVTAEEVSAQCWVTIARPGAASNSYLNWSYLAEGSGTVTLTPPNEVGTFEVRYYKAYSANDENLVKSKTVTFTVTNAQEVPADTLVYPKYEDFDWSLISYTPGQYSWTGTYNTNYRTLYLIQDGATITGTYPAWDNGRLDGIVSEGVVYGYWYEAPSYQPTADAGQLVFVMRADGSGFDGWFRYGSSGSWGVWSGASLNTHTNSAWAENAVREADARQLIPDCLMGADLTKQISRSEFAAVCVKLYEAFTGEKAEPVSVNPFEDCSDTEVLKAVNLGLTNGTDSTHFSPDLILPREQCATMLARVYKKVMFKGWTLSTDGDYNTRFRSLFTMPEPFADDDLISDWAKDSVYFMKANGIIDGVGNNLFAPKHGVSQNESVNYGLATREQALKIAVGMLTAFSD